MDVMIPSGNSVMRWTTFIEGFQVVELPDGARYVVVSGGSKRVLEATLSAETAAGLAALLRAA
ncbi:hypothetical protein [Methylovirgula sp. 4M-Z18]|uniref:hypothetical protein n=1 Tax=Methylovirgula sp. 4M-Z18 TaxID=2293567 RepID=UPI000E2EAAC1|nr:hypothetical protein [Methylovirgula sp. 4M-Z18]RFB80426.1 hypothetical protein DYH55_02540 [Methylovirgula sp. 4M-Z18]